MLGLRFCARAFSSCGKRGPLWSRCAGLSLLRPLLLRSTGSRCAGLVVVAHGPDCSAACGILPDQGSSPCPLHWQADSQPLRHQGSPMFSWWLKFTFASMQQNIGSFAKELYRAAGLLLCPAVALQICWKHSDSQSCCYDGFCILPFSRQ